MGKIILILGGARSGKSTYCIQMAKNKKGRVAFIATCEPKDLEMKKRISIHRTTRPGHWTTFEEPINIAQRVKKTGSSFKTIIIDCLTLWITNLMMKNIDAVSIERETRRILKDLKKAKADSIIVTNEVGLGIVPANSLARDFRDIAGRVNQMVAGNSSEAYFMISGIPLRIK